MTAYSVPTRFTAGDYPTNAGYVTTYGNALNHLEECLPYGGMYPCPHNDDDSDDSVDQIHYFTFQHKHRYLHWAGNGTGQIILADTSRKWTGQIDNSTWRSANSTSLSGNMSNSITVDLSMSVLDLDTVEGLEYGTMYHVRDVWSALELPTADVSSLSGGSFVTPPTTADGIVLTHTELNKYSSSLNYLHALSNRANEPFKTKYWTNADGGHAWYYSFRKSQQRDGLWYWMEGVTGAVSDVEIKFSTDGTTFGADQVPGITALSGGDIETGYIDISALVDDTLYVVSVEATLSGAFVLYTIMETEATS